MTGVVAVVREQGASAVLVLREAAGCKHDTAAGAHFDVALRRPNDGTRYAAGLDQQLPHRSLGPDLRAVIERAAEEPPRKRIAVGQTHATAV